MKAMFAPGGAGLVGANTLNEALQTLCGVFDTNGENELVAEVTRRGSKVRELRGPMMVELLDPTANTLLLPGRNDNPWASAAEFPWLIAGRADVAWLLPYLPRAAEFSDDGLTWRAGYGPRMRNWNGGHPGTKFDQLAQVVDMLRKSPDTRQAVISLWDPLQDLAPQYRPHDETVAIYGDYVPRGHTYPDPPEKRYKDYPCTNWLHFTVADGALDLTVVMRSNDLFWGFSAVNVLNFTLLQQLVAACLGLDLGTYRHVANNLHVYERHFKAVGALAAAPDLLYTATVGVGAFAHWSGPGLGVASLAAFTTGAGAALRAVEAHRGRWLATGATARQTLAPLAYRMDPWLLEWAEMMLLHDLRNGAQEWGDFVEQCILGIDREDWRLAVTANLMRKWWREGTLSDINAADMAACVAAGVGNPIAAERLLLLAMEG